MKTMSSSNENECKLFFTISPDNYVYVNMIMRCEPYSGTHLLKKMIEYSKMMNVKCVKLEDATAFIVNGCDGGYNIFEFLIKGMSWYNKHGFVSENFDEELKHNEKISEIMFDDLLDNAKIQKDKFVKNFPEIVTENKTIREVFVELHLSAFQMQN